MAKAGRPRVNTKRDAEMLWYANIGWKHSAIALLMHVSAGCVSQALSRERRRLRVG